jgi:hypothetical protein
MKLWEESTPLGQGFPAGKSAKELVSAFLGDIADNANHAVAVTLLIAQISQCPALISTAATPK